MRFLEIAPAELPGNMRVDDPITNKHMAGLFAKVVRTDTVFETLETRDAGYDQGIFVDIFPYGIAAADEDEYASQKKDLTKVVRKKYLYFTRHINVPHRGILGKAEAFGCNVAHILVKAATSPDRLNEEFWKVAFSRNPEKRPARPGDKIISFCYPEIPLKYEDVVPTMLVSFEQEKFPVPHNTDMFLCTFYGDWQQLPPVEDRKTHKPLVLVLPEHNAE